LGQTSGTLTLTHAPAESELAALSARVTAANGWERPAGPVAFPPFRHVIYVIRENRTFDQVLGDLRGVDGDGALTPYPRAVAPHAHALAGGSGAFDRFCVNAEGGGQAHNWPTGAYTSDYVEKRIPSVYSGRGRSYDYDGLNDEKLAQDDVNEP